MKKKLNLNNLKYKIKNKIQLTLIVQKTADHQNIHKN